MFLQAKLMNMIIYTQDIADISKMHEIHGKQRVFYAPSMELQQRSNAECL